MVAVRSPNPGAIELSRQCRARESYSRRRWLGREIGHNQSPGLARGLRPSLTLSIGNATR